MPPDRPFRVGIAGAGLMGRWHAHAARRAGARLVAVADPDPVAVRRLASGGGVAAYDDSIALARSGAVDVLHVCTPLDTHAALVREALGNGLHVLVEKPLAPDQGETDSLVGEAARSGLKLCPVHQFAFQRGFLQLQERLDSLGQLRSVDALFHSAGAEGLDASGRDQVAFDILPHPLSMLYRLDSTLSIDDDWSVDHGGPGELSCTIASAGAVYRIRISLGSRPPRTWLHVHGTNGSAHVNLFHGYVFFESPESGRRRKVTLPFEHAFRQAGVSAVNLARRAFAREPAYPGLMELVRRFYDSVRTGDDTPVSASETKWVARTRDVLFSKASIQRARHE